VRKNSPSGKEKTLDFSIASISRQLLAKGYIGKPGGGRNLTARVRIPEREENRFSQEDGRFMHPCLKQENEWMGNFLNYMFLHHHIVIILYYKVYLIMLLHVLIYISYLSSCYVRE
jgi:hypothetical protein